MADMTYEQYIAQLQEAAANGDPNAARKLQELQAFSEQPGLNQQQQITNAQTLATDPAAAMQQNGQAILQPSSGAANAPVAVTPQNSGTEELAINGAPGGSATVPDINPNSVAPPSTASNIAGGSGAAFDAGVQASRAGGRKVSKGESIGTGAASGALAGVEFGLPGVVAGGVIGGAMGAMGGDEGDTTQEKIAKEQLQSKQTKNNFVDPTNSMDDHGNESNLYLLAHYGPLSRIPAVANAGLKMSGQDPLTKREAILNFLRPPIPMYNAANANKAYSAATNHKRMMNVITGIGLGVSALSALGNVGKAMVIK